jgi:hypothetical protein
VADRPLCHALINVLCNQGGIRTHSADNDISSGRFCCECTHFDFSNACPQCKSRVEQRIKISVWYSKNGRSKSILLKPETGDLVGRPINIASLRLYGLKLPHYINSILPWVFKLHGLVELDIEECSFLESVNAERLVRIASLEKLNCARSSRLWSPPREVRMQGGKAAMDFLREVQQRGAYSTQMTLFLIGDGESGKTSVINAIRSENDRAERIFEDNRTVGIDVYSWCPNLNGAEVEYKIFDLAGQAVYGKTHQLFLQLRALYMLVWRAHNLLLHDDRGLRERITYWMDSLQLRIPGS